MTHTLIKTLSLAVAFGAVLIAPELTPQNTATQTEQLSVQFHSVP